MSVSPSRSPPAAAEAIFRSTLRGGGGEHETHTLNFPPGQPIEYRLPFRVSGGIPPYESRLLRDEGEDPNCPGWVTLFPDQRILAGTAPATAAGGTFFCVYEVKEKYDPGFRPARTVTHGLRLTVGAGLELPQPGNVYLSVGRRDSRELPRAAGGMEPYSYALTCDGGVLPRGMSFNPETREFEGTPDTRFAGSCTNSVTDSSSSAATRSRVIEIEIGSLAPSDLLLPSTSEQSLSVGTFYSAALPAATGGQGSFLVRPASGVR